MKKQFQHLILVSMILIFTESITSLMAIVPPTPVIQWSTHVDCNNGGNSNSKDWVFKIRHTKDGGYIACGYSRRANTSSSSYDYVPILYRLDMNGNLIWQKLYPLSTNASLWYFNDVIEDSHGNFAAVGQSAVGFVNSRAILVTTYSDGTISNTPTALLPTITTGGHVFTFLGATGISETPDGKYALTLVGSYTGGNISSFIVITDGVSTTLPVFWQLNPSAAYSNSLQAIKTGNGSSGNFDLVACGSQVINTTPITGCRACESIPCLFTNNGAPAVKSDIIVASVHYNGTSLTQNWVYQSASTIFPPNYIYSDYGPYSTTYGTNCSGCSQFSDFYNNMANASHNELGSDLLVNQNNEIVIAAFTDFLWQDDKSWYTNGGTITDCSPNRPCSPVVYDEYKDANAWLLKLDYSGNLVTPSSNNGQNNPSHIAHFSGDDFRMEVDEDCNGNIYIDGSTADNLFCSASSDLLPYPIQADVLICKVDKYFSKIWRKHYHSSGLNRPSNCTGSFDYECGFGLVVNSDNSVTVCGNNSENGDDAFFTKFSSDEQILKTTWDYPSGSVAPAGTTTWPLTFSTIKGTLRVPSGSTLIIDRSTIEFGETRELFNYFDDPATVVNPNQCGIVVEKGGQLIVRNQSLLRGLEKDPNNSCSRDYMWDGISVEGDPGQPENPLLQGTVQILGGSKIQDARCGIRYDSRTWFNNQIQTINPSETWDRGRLSYPEYEGHGGGFGLHDYATFLNCRKGVEFLPYPNSNGSGFSNCTFICNGPMVDPDFTYVIWDGLNETYGPLGLNTHISMWDVHNINFKTNTFTNIGTFDWDKRGTGISSIDADYNLFDDNYFWTMTFGISAADENSMATIFSENSHFMQNSRGIYNLGINFQTYVNNEFEVGYNGKGDYGMNLESCTDYIVQQNRFINHNDIGRLTYGIVDYFSFVNQNDNLIYNNRFDNFDGAAALAEGIQNDGGTRGLQLKCNEYNLNVFDEFTPDLSPILGPLQGICAQQGSNAQHAGADNKFDTQCAGSNEGELHNEPTGFVQPYIYFYDQTNGGINTTPDNGCFTPIWVQPQPTGALFNAQDCPNNYRLSSRDQKMVEMNGNKTQEQSLVQILNAGDKSALLNAINNGNAAQAMSVLRSASPYLSSDVLSTAIRSGLLSDDSLNAILQANSPLPEDAMKSLVADLTIASGNMAPDIQVASNSVNATSTDVQPDVNVKVNSVNIQTTSSIPSVGITASFVSIDDATGIDNLPDSLQSISQTSIQVAVNTGNQASTDVGTAVGKLKLDKNGISKADSIISLIHFYDSEYNRNFDETVDLFLRDTTIHGLDSVTVMLENETGINRKMQLEQAYVVQRKYNSALQLLNDLQQYSDLDNFTTLENSMIALKQQHKSWFDIKNDAGLYATIQNIANDSTHAGYASARAILMQIDGVSYPAVIKFDPTTQSYRKRKEALRWASGQELLRNFPNPFNNQTIIEAQVDDKINSPMLIIYDVVGGAIKTFALLNGFNSIVISSGSLKPGVYYYSIVSNDKRIATEKMICLQ